MSKKYTTEEIDSYYAKMVKRVSEGVKVSEAAKELGIPPANYYAWKKHRTAVSLEKVKRATPKIKHTTFPLQHSEEKISFRGTAKAMAQFFREIGGGQNA